MELPDTWKSMIMEATMNDDGYQADTKEIPRIQQALENLRKQHLWGDLTDKSLSSRARCFRASNEARLTFSSSPDISQTLRDRQKYLKICQSSGRTPESMMSNGNRFYEKSSPRSQLTERE